MAKKREEMVQVRASTIEKGYWANAAAEKGLALSQWLRLVANAAANIKMDGIGGTDGTREG